MALPPVLRDRLRLPVIGSPLFIVSNPDLVIAQCKAGIVGSFPALNARPASMLDEWLHRITEELAQKAPIKMIFPLATCFFPAILMIAAGPGVLALMKALGR